MFRSIMLFNTSLIMNMFITYEQLLLFLRRGRNHVASNHANFICHRYFDDMNVVIPLVVSCERRLHDTSPYLGLRECIVE